VAGTVTLALTGGFAHVTAAGWVAEWFKAPVLKFDPGHPA
jgi:hypothetical protein